MSFNKAIVLHIIVYILVLVGMLMLLPVLDADDFTPTKFNPAQYVQYERQLNAILKTRRDEEKKFVHEVVVKVREGKIPAKLVNTSFDWVRKKRPTTNYPFIYFERVLRLQADRLKIGDEVPDFDFSIYQKPVGQLQPGQRMSAGQTTETYRNSFNTPGTRR